MFSRALQQLHVFPRFAPLTRFPALDTGYMFWLCCTIPFKQLIVSHYFQNLRLNYYQEDDVIDEMTLAKGTNTVKAPVSGHPREAEKVSATGAGRLYGNV